MEEWRQCGRWLIDCKVLPPNHRVVWPSAVVFDLAQALRDGVLLCQLLHNLSPGSIDLKDINFRPQMSQVGRGWVVGGPPGAPPSLGEGVALSKLGGMRECERVWGGDAWETDCFILPTPVCSSPVPRPSCPGGIRVRPGKGFGTEKKHPRKEGNIPPSVYSHRETKANNTAKREEMGLLGFF